MWDVLVDGLKTAFSRKLTFIALVAVPVIVGLFGLLYVATFQDPVGNLENVPIAVVNLDEGAIQGNEYRNYGDELAESLLDNNSADWTREDATLLDSGLETSTYYLAVLIPQDFSAHIAAGDSGTPEQSGITFYRNMRKNYMLSTLSTRVESALSEEINEKVSAQYAQALAQGLQEAGDGLGEAAEGAREIVDGTTALQDGTANASAGAKELSAGSSRLEDGATKLDAAAGKVAAGSAEIQDGLAALSGNSGTLTDGWAQVDAGASSLAEGSRTLTEGSARFEAGVAENLTQAQAAADVEGAQAAVREAVITLVQTVQHASISSDAAAVEAAQANLETAIATLAGAAGQQGAAQALAGVQEGYAPLAGGIAQLDEGATALAEGSATFGEALSQYTSGVDSAAEGAGTLADGASRVASGAGSLASGTASLASGAGKLSSGLSQIEEGVGTLHEGGKILADSLEDGSSNIADSLTAEPAEYGTYVSHPVEVSTESYGEMDYFGYGFAPFFMTLCLWLGSLLTFFIFEPFPSYTRFGAGRVAAVFGRWPLYLLLIALEITAVCGGSMLLGIPHIDTGAYVMQFCVVGFSFMCIMQLLNLFDIPGKAVAILILVFQICCGSGTFPVILGADYAQAVAPFIPFTYSIDAFREILSGGNLAVAYADMGILLVFAFGAVALTLLAYPKALKLKVKRDREKLAELSLMPSQA